MSRFLRVQCSGCSNQQVIFNKPASTVLCLACGKSLAKPVGGKGLILGKIKQIFE
jgi:small subunit ribosomal protein S27e